MSTTWVFGSLEQLGQILRDEANDATQLDGNEGHSRLTHWGPFRVVSSTRRQRAQLDYSRALRDRVETRRRVMPVNHYEKEAMIRRSLLVAGLLISAGLVGAGGPEVPKVEIAATVCFLEGPGMRTASSWCTSGSKSARFVSPRPPPPASRFALPTCKCCSMESISAASSVRDAIAGPPPRTAPGFRFFLRR